MAKTAKIKNKQSTLHSRAARRALSPSINLNLDKPAATTTSKPHHASSTTASKPHILAAQPTGISKTSKTKSKSKPLKRQQRARQQKTMERAADALDKLELKRQKSVGKEKKVRERRKGWEEVNTEKREKAQGNGEGKRGNAFEGLDEDEGGDGEREWVSDEEMDLPEVGGDRDEDGDDVVGGAVQELEVVVPASVPLPQATLEEDEML